MARSTIESLQATVLRHQSKFGDRCCAGLTRTSLQVHVSSALPFEQHPSQIDPNVAMWGSSGLGSICQARSPVRPRRVNGCWARRTSAGPTTGRHPTSLHVPLEPRSSLTRPDWAGLGSDGPSGPANRRSADPLAQELPKAPLKVKLCGRLMHSDPNILPRAVALAANLTEKEVHAVARHTWRSGYKSTASCSVKCPPCAGESIRSTSQLLVRSCTQLRARTRLRSELDLQVDDATSQAAPSCLHASAVFRACGSWCY